ncbi:hypothetical protein [Allohahella marinimesophila]|uniref:Uncharacterized protein n=1 Tax=Allohahella marinimesophila TaxID=1054972 RepID=A0ABP7Q069_9GAMM
MKSLRIAGLTVLMISTAALAEEAVFPKITAVYVCKDDIGFETGTNQWYVAQKTEFYESGVNRILTLTLQSNISNLPVRINTDPAPFRWCGMDGVLNLNHISLVK